MGILSDAIALELASARSSVTATADGLTTGLIAANTPQVSVTSDSASKKISLPAATVGDIIRIAIGATGCELISAVAAHKANNVTVGATNQLALAANCSYTCEYVSENNWRIRGYDIVGGPLGRTAAVLATITIADAAGTPDYALSAVTVTSPIWLATAQEGISLLYVIQNLQLRVLQLETAAVLVPDAI